MLKKIQDNVYRYKYSSNLEIFVSIDSFLMCLILAMLSPLTSRVKSEPSRMKFDTDNSASDNHVSFAEINVKIKMTHNFLNGGCREF